jgi:TonB-dependent starch-binding outer membrane protein SusC
MHLTAHVDAVHSSFSKNLHRFCKTKTLLVVKLVTIFLLAGCLQVSASGYGQNISVSGKGLTLKKVFNEIQRQTGYSFLYFDKDLQNAKKITIDAHNEDLKDVLNAVFAGQPLTYTIIQNTIVVKNKPAEVQALQPVIIEVNLIDIRGSIVNENNEPVAGASIRVKSTTAGTVSDAQGKFVLTGIDEKATLIISGTNIETVELKVAGRNELGAIKVTTKVGVLSTVEVGYGAVKRKDITGSVASVDINEIKNVPFMTIDAAMVGKAPGLQITKADGSPGGAVRIRIRGGASLIGSNDPLYIIDGVPVLVENKYVGVTDMTNPIENYGGENARNSSISGSFSRGLNNLAGLNLDDIETIDILKDASATAIYGSKAANGVVIITTKKGKRNQKPVLEINNYTGISKALREKVLDAGQYKMIMLEAATNRVTEDIRLSRSANTVAKAIVDNPALLGNSSVNTDWLGLVLRTGITQNTNISVRGGGTGSTYYTSLAYTNQKGALLGSDFNRIAGKVNLDNEITSKLRVITNIDYAFSKTNITNGIYASALQAPPIFSPYDADGSFTNFDLLFGSLTPAGSGSDFGIQNPLAMATAINRGQNNTVLGSLTAHYDILKDLKFISTASVNYSNYRQRNYIPSYLEIANPNSQGGQSSNGGVGSQSNSTTVNTFYENTLTWNKQFNDNNRLNLLGGTSWEKYTTEFFSAEGRGYPNDNFLNNLNSAAVPTVVRGANPSGEYSLLSFYIRANYALKERYLFTFTGRNDISSKFAPGKQAAYFPSGAFAWRLSEESFMKGIKWVNELKLRVSAGYTGSQSIGNYLYHSLYSPVAYAGASAFVPTQLGNADIEWERTLQKDLGVDFALLNNRLRGTVGYYEKNTSGLLLNMTPPPSYAFSSVIMNVANIRNRGFEFELRGDIVKKKHFNWNIAFNIANNVSKVTSIRGGPFSDPNNRNALNLGTSIVREGDPMGLIYGRQFLGIAGTNKEATDYLQAVLFARLFNPWFNAGDMKYDTSQSSYKQGVIGNMNPKFFGGITNTFSYKNFTLTTLFNYSYGNDILFQADVRDRNVNNLSNKGVRVLERWTVQNPSTTRARLLYGRSEFMTSANVYDGSFIKLKSLTLGYELPQKATNTIKLRSASFYLSATNLFVITKYPGLDPEVTDDPRSIIGGGRDLSMYPTTREVTIGLRIGL